MLTEVESLIVKGLKELFKRELDTPQLQIIHEIYKDIRGAMMGRDEKDVKLLEGIYPPK